MSKPRAYQLIDAAKIATNLSTIVDTQPSHESQLRPLTKLEPNKQREVWKEATKDNPKPTAAEVSRAVKKA